MSSRLDRKDEFIKLVVAIVGGIVPKKVTLCSPVLAALGFANPKANCSILVTLFPMVTLVKLLKKKALLSIFVTS